VFVVSAMKSVVNKLMVPIARRQASGEGMAAVGRRVLDRQGVRQSLVPASCHISDIVGVTMQQRSLSVTLYNRQNIQPNRTPSSRLQSRSMFIQTEVTPNPHSLKYIPEGAEVLPEKLGTGMNFSSLNAPETKLSPLAIKLFQLEGIKNVFFGRDFISITKKADLSWHVLKPSIFSIIFDYYAEGKPLVLDAEVVTDTTILDTDSEVVAMIKELLETRIRPAVQEDGGDIHYVGFDVDTGLVKVRLAGSCVGCPSSSITLRNGVEKMLKHYIPEVQGIEEAAPEGEDDTSDSISHPHDPNSSAAQAAATTA
jgi:Fe-S cluster biogenesis protein NfuA